MTKISIDPILFNWSGQDSTLLIASQCCDCNIVQFPQQRSCTACSSHAVKQIELKREGILWSWTSQNYPPSSPPYKVNLDDFKPFLLGYIELSDQVRVQSKILAELDQLSIGMSLSLTFEPLFTNEANQTVMTYAFKPS